MSYACLTIQELAHLGNSIRSVQASDIESIRQWRNAQMDILRQSSVITRAQQLDYFEHNVWCEMTEEQPRNIILTYISGGVPIGYGGLVHIAWDHLRAEVSFLDAPERALDSELYHSDFATFLCLVKKLAFDHLGLHRLFTETYDVRPHHISTLEKSGFSREGTMRHHVRIAGNPVDSIIHGCVYDLEK